MGERKESSRNSKIRLFDENKHDYRGIYGRHNSRDKIS